jgi:hypothetical protein
MTDIESRSVAWARNPEPSIPDRDPQTIVEAEPVAYIWNTQNETTEWLHFSGETMEITQ